MNCKKCGAPLKVVRNAAEVADVSCDGDWVCVQLEWWCPSCEQDDAVTQWYYDVDENQQLCRF